MPRFEGEEYHNVYAEDGTTAFTDKYKQKAVEVVRMNNTDKCSTAINGAGKMIVKNANGDTVAQN